MDELSAVRAPIPSLSLLKVGSRAALLPGNQMMNWIPPGSQARREPAATGSSGSMGEKGREKCAHLLVVRDLSYQHLRDLSGHVAIIIHFSLPENSDVCPNPITARPQLPHLACTPPPPAFHPGSGPMAFPHVPKSSQRVTFSPTTLQFIPYPQIPLNKPTNKS